MLRGYPQNTGREKGHLPLKCHQVMAVGEYQKFHAVREVELLQDGSQMVTDRCLADAEPVRCLLVPESLAYQSDDLTLAGGQLHGGVGLCPTAGRWFRPPQFVDNSGRHLAIQPELSRMYPIDGLDQHFSRRAFANHSHGSLTDCATELIFIPDCCEKTDARFRRCLHQVRDQIDTILVCEAEIQEDDFGLFFRSQSNGISPIAGFSDRHPVRMFLY